MRECEYCGAEFKLRKPTSKYCNIECLRAKTAKKEVVCERVECGKITREPNRFCSRDCASKANGPKRSRRGQAGEQLFFAGYTSQGKRVYKKRCPEGCGGLCHVKSSRCQDCRRRIERDQSLERWLRGEEIDRAYLPKPIRIWMLEEAEYKCSLCGFDKNHPVDGNTILEIDHINGVGNDHKYENLRVVCPNCHALTDTYKTRNKGKGRTALRDEGWPKPL